MAGLVIFRTMALCATSTPLLRLQPDGACSHGIQEWSTVGGRTAGATSLIRNGGVSMYCLQWFCLGIGGEIVKLGTDLLWLS